MSETHFQAGHEHLIGSPEDPVNQFLSAEFPSSQLWQSDRQISTDTLKALHVRPLTIEQPDKELETVQDNDDWLEDDSQAVNVTSKGIAVEADPDWTWLAVAYGARIIEGTEPDEKVLQTADLGTMCFIQERLRATVLRGEHPHTARLVMPPTPQQVLDGDVSLDADIVANNNTWLDTYAEGFLPVMAIEADADMEGGDESGFDPHDWNYMHTLNNLFFPREVQDEVSTAAARARTLRLLPQSERERYERALRMAQSKDIPVRNIAWGDFNTPHHFRKPGRDYVNPIEDIDVLTDTPGYADVLMHIKGGQSGAEQVQILRDEITHLKHDYRFSEVGSALTTISLITASLVPLVEFNTWYAEGRKPTAEEINAKIDGFFTGLARLGDKLAGRHEYTEADTEEREEIDVTPFWQRSAS